METCPTCGARSVYHEGADRYFHADGSNNRECWRLAVSKPWISTCRCCPNQPQVSYVLRVSHVSNPRTEQ